MERLHRLATRVVKDCRDSSYEERQIRLNLFSFIRRRWRGDLILASYLSIGPLDLPLEEFFTRPPCSSLQGNSLELYHRRFRWNRRKATFSVRIVGPWNRLPAFVFEAQFVKVFKSTHAGLTCSPALFSILPLRFSPFHDFYMGFSAITVFQPIKSN